jgi:hypothetical protein
MRTIKTGLAVVVAAGAVALPLMTRAATAGANTPKSCAPSQITVTRGTPNGAAGTIYYPIVFTNTGPTCTIFGAPAIQPVAGKARYRVGPPARNLSMGLMPAIHTLKSGRSVAADVGFGENSNYPVARCKPKRVSGVLVTLGSFVSRRFVALGQSVCTLRSSVTTRLVTPGVTGI